jgi:rhomboid protease GluP
VEQQNAAPRPPTPWVTIALIAANVIVFAWELSSGASAMDPSPQKLVDVGGNLPALTLGGQWWRLGSAMFLHAGVVHIGMNMVCLWQARLAEAAFGRAAYATIYVVAGLLGGIATALHGQSNVVSVGASGAVFGVYGAFFALLFVRRAAFPPEVWQKIVRQMATFLGINFALGFSVKGIDMSAHVGGLAAGALGGAALVIGGKRGPAAIGRTLALAIVGLAIVGGVVVAKHKAAPKAADDPARIATDAELHFLRIEMEVGDGTPTLAQGDEVEREILAPWKGIRAQLDQIETPDDGHRAFALGAYRRYAASMQTTMEAFVAWAHAPADQQQVRGDAFHRAAEQLEQDEAAMKAAVKDLK